MNIPGILKIEKIEFDQVDLPFLRKNDTIDLSSYLAGDLRAIDFITDTAGIRVVQQRSDAGLYFDIDIPFTIAGYDSDLLDDLEYTSRKPHVYVVTEKTGLKYLVGFSNHPHALFNYEIKSDPDANGGRSVACRIIWRTTVFPVFIEGSAGGGFPD